MSKNINKTTLRDTEILNHLCGEQLSIKLENDENQYFCYCRGIHPEKYLLTQIPAVIGIENNLTPGKQVVVRFVESGKVCGFKTRVQQSIIRPYRLLFLDYPESIEMINLRASKRIDVSLKASILWRKEAFDGQIRDLSGGGCFFTMKYWQDPHFDDLSLGSEISIKFSIPDEDSPVELKCKLARIIKEEDDLKMGLSFDNEQKEPLDRVAVFINYISQLLES